MRKAVQLLCLLLLQPTLSFAQVPKGSPGVVPNWSSAKKVQVGTYFESKKSLVWFTNTQGVLTETYFPYIDKAQIKDAELLITDGKSFMSEERTQTIHSVEILSPSLVKLINTDYLNRFETTHTFFTLKNRNVLIDEVTIESHIDGLEYYLLVNPALNNTGFLDNAYAPQDSRLIFIEKETKLTVTASSGFEGESVGFVGFSDGWQELNKNFTLKNLYQKAENGNVAGTAKIKLPNKKGKYSFYIIYSFEQNDVSFSESELSLAKHDYKNAWDDYLSKMKSPVNVSETEDKLYKRSLYTLRVHEDKINEGALIASLSKPWGEDLHEYPNVFTGGYHLIWPRDLYHVCTALIQAGDLETATRALKFLKRIQYQSGVWNYGERVIEKKGAFPQNTWTNTQEYWGGLQLDQTAYPIHIFYQLYTRADETQKEYLLNEYGQMVKDALYFITSYGPWSAQERWEENFGISTSSFSAATSALKMGTRVFHDSYFENVANGWLTKPYDNIHSWTFTNNGHFGDGQYYIRVGGCSHYTAPWNPNNKAYCHVANSGQRVEQSMMIDQGFLKLALLGLVPATDWKINHSLEILNNTIRVTTPKGDGWYRYSYDAYGEEKKGRLWPLLSGEHARFAIEKFNDGGTSWEEASQYAHKVVKSYLGFANSGLMLPEQVFESSGEGTGAATPLAWSHAEYIKLIWSLEVQKNVENLIE